MARPRNAPYAGRIEAIYEILARCAAEKKPCPTNPEIATALKIPTPSAVSEFIKDLETLGKITVDRSGGHRRVFIIATGEWTYWTSYHPVRKVKGDMRVDASALPRVEMDPCTYCGVRGDVPCRHKPAWRLAELQAA